MSSDEARSRTFLKPKSTVCGKVSAFPINDAFAARVDAATAAVLATASTSAELPIVNLALLATIFGTVRNVFERDLPSDQGQAVRQQVMWMCSVYLETVRLPR